MHNAQFSRRHLVRGMTRSTRAAEGRAKRVETVETNTHVIYVIWCHGIPHLVN